jgi:hypothetical protein
MNKSKWRIGWNEEFNRAFGALRSRIEYHKVNKSNFGSSSLDTKALDWFANRSVMLVWIQFLWSRATLARKSRRVMGLLALAATTFSLYRQEQLTTKTDLVGSPNDRFRSINNVVYVYSQSRTDRTGAVVHDRFLAHAFTYHLNRSQHLLASETSSLVYGGACLGNMPFSPRPRSERLLRFFGWDTVIPYRCPSKQEKAVYIPNEVYKCVGESNLLTEDWRDQFWREARAKRGWHNLSQSDVDEDVFRIAAHIRRGDVDLCRYHQRYLPNSHYLRLIDEHIPANRKTEVTIFSESRSFESFDVFRARNYTMRLDSSLETVWQGMHTANVAILSRSTFSLSSSFLNPNTVVYTPFWNGGLSHWKTVNETAMATTDSEIKEMWLKFCSQKKVRAKFQPRAGQRKSQAVDASDFVIPLRKSSWWNWIGYRYGIRHYFAPAKVIGPGMPLAPRTHLSDKFERCLAKYLSSAELLA